MRDNKFVAPKLVYGVGINDADYVVQMYETIGYVDGWRLFFKKFKIRSKK